MPENLLEKLDLVANVPNAVTRVRAMILQSGVQGRLVTRNKGRAGSCCGKCACK